MAEETKPKMPAGEKKAKADAAPTGATDAAKPSKKAAGALGTEGAADPAKKPSGDAPAAPVAAPAAPTAAELLADADAGKKIIKAKGAKNIAVGVANILATFNNTNVSITDMEKHGVCRAAGGAGRRPPGDVARDARSGSPRQRSRFRPGIRDPRASSNWFGNLGDQRRYASAPQRVPSAQKAPRLN
jgi:hypothetical protein